jgi:hypothetical protein
MRFDAHSVQVNVRCSLDRTTRTLALEVPEAAARVQLPGDPELTGDLLGRPFTAPVMAGPFADLRPGRQRIGLPVPDNLREVLPAARVSAGKDR